MLSKPTNGEVLFLYIAASEASVSSILVRQDDSSQRPVYYVSKGITGPETRYPENEKLALNLMVATRKLQPYF